MMRKQNKAYLCSIIIGISLLLIGLIIQIPGGALTTYESLNGNSTDYHVFDNKYSSIDEYVGGDAYNYIIGATLVAGKIAGIMTTKAIFIVGGAICICFGLTLMFMNKKETLVNDSIVTNAQVTRETEEVINNEENRDESEVPNEEAQEFIN